MFTSYAYYTFTNTIYNNDLFLLFHYLYVFKINEIYKYDNYYNNYHLQFTIN